MQQNVCVFILKHTIVGLSLTKVMKRQLSADKMIVFLIVIIPSNLKMYHHYALADCAQIMQFFLISYIILTLLFSLFSGRGRKYKSSKTNSSLSVSLP